MLLHGPEMSGEIWKMNVTRSSVEGKKKEKKNTLARAERIFFFRPCVFVRKRDESEVFRNYRVVLAGIGNTWEFFFFFFFHQRSGSGWVKACRSSTRNDL